MPNWAEPYTATYFLHAVDRDTWETDEEIGKLRSFSVERNATEDVPLLESCSGEADITAEPDPSEGWYRVVAHVSQRGLVERVPIMTFLRQDGERPIGRSITRTSFTGYSSLKPADLKVLPRGTYITKGANGPAHAKRLLEEGGVLAPIKIVGDYTISSYVVFDLGSTYLNAAWKVLDAAGYVMMIDPNGEITICPKPDMPSLILDAANARLVRVGGKVNVDKTEVANVYYAIDGDNRVKVVNDLDDSRTSIKNRGLESDIMDTSPTLVDGESLDVYAMRMLKESSIVHHDYKYVRRYWPDVRPFSLVQATSGVFGITEHLVVKQQSLSFGKGITVSETASYEEVTYDPWQLR